MKKIKVFCDLAKKSRNVKVKTMGLVYCHCFSQLFSIWSDRCLWDEIISGVIIGAYTRGVYTTTTKI